LRCVLKVAMDALATTLAAGEADDAPRKIKKAKKHKKHHKHSRGEDGEETAGGLKLRIKVGASANEEDQHGGGGGGHSKKKKKKDKKKKHHKHKEKRKREEERQEEVPEDEDEDEEPPAKRPALAAESSGEEEEDDESSKPPSERKLTERPLFKLLSSILPRLEKMDPNKFFALPVSDQIAPGYSQIIKDPMDFSAIKSRLNSGHYVKLQLFKADVELMCVNAMTYNTQDTIYYKTAKKLRAVGRALLTPRRLIPMREQLAFMEELTEDDLGFDIMGEPDQEAFDDEEGKGEGADGDDEEDEEDEEDMKDVDKVIEDIREVVRRPPGKIVTSLDKI